MTSQHHFHTQLRAPNPGPQPGLSVAARPGAGLTVTAMGAMALAAAATLLAPGKRMRRPRPALQGGPNRCASWCHSRPGAPPTSWRAPWRPS